MQIVMKCVSLVSYAVRINGWPFGEIHPMRGLKQGDPLSLYLFLIFPEGLSALLHKSVQRKRLKGMVASGGGPRVSHLFFANDSLIFGRATLESASKYKGCYRFMNNLPGNN